MMDKRRELTQRLQVVCGHGYVANEVMNATGNVMLSCLEQVYPTAKDATTAFDEVARRMRHELEARYDSATGRRRPKIARPSIQMPATLR